MTPASETAASETPAIVTPASETPPGLRRLRVLLLGGTSEASALAGRLAGDTRFEATLSLAGITRQPAHSPLPTRSGGFGGAAGLATWLVAGQTDVLVDATHPFARRMRDNARQAAALAGVALLRLTRPPWAEQPGDRWIAARDADHAAGLLGEAPRRVFLALGAKGLAGFAARPEHSYLVRCIDPPPAELLPRGAGLVLARGPFTLEGELALLRAHAIEILVAKNSGGPAAAAKLAAARMLSLPMVMIGRPAEAAGRAGSEAPVGAQVESAEAALDWLGAHRATERGV